MIIIGEKINGFIPAARKAIEERDESYIRSLAIEQTECGADYLDVCAGTSPELERETMEWLIDLAQDSSDTPICIDSSDINLIIDLIPRAKRPGIVNSVSGEGNKCDILFPKIADTEWKIIALTCDEKNGIPNDPDIKYEIAKDLIEKARSYNIGLDRMFIDPLVTSVATTSDALLSFNAAVRKIKKAYPEVRITSGLSNISYGMPLRGIINRQFLALAMSAGMDSAIMDPTSSDMRATLYATDILLENDRGCKRFLKAYRKGLIGSKKK
ncbi:MAG: methyltetrahydrofolate cobalamin methyltransferase [Clostridiales Family XIII bacterium]|jgi:5-methyltetrahydrofolate--homocysteine methyltransferase|nr:methyltetrahydrofolate cobalamin methyltransferase [Clostridiales Family XIII bacterium]